jgi:uracil-DNA glycosylase
MNETPRRAGATALDRHCRALATCARCNLAAGVRPIVSEARRTRAMLVGQAPGQVEAEGGRPFSGRAGRTLFRWLARAGLDEETARRRVYIAAVTRCYPGPSPSGRGDRVPNRGEQDACGAWLESELRIIRPRLVIPVGRLAIERFLPSLPLDALVGKEHIVARGAGTMTVIPLPHPSGASSWIHTRAHTTLLDRALDLLRARFMECGISAENHKRVA